VKTLLPEFLFLSVQLVFDLMAAGVFNYLISSFFASAVLYSCGWMLHGFTQIFHVPHAPLQKVFIISL
jgi:hypothetical protein